MGRSNPIFTPIGFIMGAGLFIGLGLSLFWNGALAFSPGKLSSSGRSEAHAGGFRSHADFEKECHRCHQPLKTRQVDLCLECHTPVAEQLATAAGLHSRFAEAWRCDTCHGDHQGRAFDPLQAALASFDHSLTRFNLARHQLGYQSAPLLCNDCHPSGIGSSDTQPACIACHTDHAPGFMAQHQQDFGPACLDCHEGSDRLARLDHDATAFQLDGQHKGVTCAGCHAGGRFEGTPVACAGCHAEPALHQGALGIACADCHTSAGWSPAQLEGELFEHLDQTGFSLARHRLDYNHQLISCLGCHGENLHTFETAACAGCHNAQDPAFMSGHLDQFGSTCLTCHDGADRMHHFEHASIFPLEGRHAEIECRDCHLEQVFRGTPEACAGCHAEPDIHVGSFGLQCQYCHAPLSWIPARLQAHVFPLAHGGQGQIACQTCHLSTYAVYTCYGCHDHQPEDILERHARAGVSTAELPACARCHPEGE
jgi:hypothetical protein